MYEWTHNGADPPAQASARPAQPDVCVAHGYTPGTDEYLRCWEYVTRTNQVSGDRVEQQKWRDLMNAGAQMQRSAQPQLGACTNIWGTIVPCVLP